MKQKQFLNLVLGLSMILQLAIGWDVKATEGRDVGNGGGTWACREGLEPTGALRWVRLVDLDEAVGEHGLELLTGPTTVEGYLREIEIRIESLGLPQFTSRFQSHLTRVKQSIQIRPGRRIMVIDDADVSSEPAPEECESGIIRYEQLANYRDDGSILVDERLYQRLSVIEQAALYVHEALYALLREAPNSDQNSVRARRATGILFSNTMDRTYFTQFAIDRDSTIPRPGLYRAVEITPPMSTKTPSSFSDVRVSLSGFSVIFAVQNDTRAQFTYQCDTAGCRSGQRRETHRFETSESFSFIVLYRGGGTVAEIRSHGDRERSSFVKFIRIGN